jgi:hypothetical protein
MNCADARARLAALLYGDLPDGEARDVRHHLGRCDSCRNEYAALADVGRLLDAVPAPAVTVDLAGLYREAAARQSRRLRRWRRVAWASLAAAAAVVLTLLLSRVELRLDANQVSVRWGAAPAPPEPLPPAPHPEPRVIAVTQAASTTEIEQQLRLLNEVVQTLSNDADSRDERHRNEIDRLRAQVTALQRQLADLRLATEKDVADLYATQIPEKEKGASP